MLELLYNTPLGDILEVFPKAAGSRSHSLGLEWTPQGSLPDPDELSALLLELLPFARNVPPQELVLEQLDFLLAPGYCVVDVPAQISDEVEPARLLLLLVLSMGFVLSLS